jgi:hypothetical protein
MPPVESRRERLAAEVASRLAAIDATLQPTTYWYTPTKVLRVDIHDVRYLRSKLPSGGQVDVIYLLMPGDNFPKEETTHEFEMLAELWLLGAKRWQPESIDPWFLADHASDINILKETVQNRLMQDVRTKLLQGIQLDGLISNLEITDESYLNIDENPFPWAAVEMRLTARFSHEAIET